ncbi:MAG TPA: selenide, water dikinase SelD [Candidatus Angelobacter sp.]
MSPAVLDAVLGKLARQNDANVLVGFDKADDAGVYRISREQALVQTVDFFTPIVDDPFTFGQIAATNSLSDVYAMGGKPLSALAIVCFPEKEDISILEQILSGGLSKMIEANCTVIGGHSVRDPEIKFGYAVTGSIHPDRVLTNANAQILDALLLTKPLGTGIISTAIKKGEAEPAWIESASRAMTTLNRAAADLASSGRFHVHSATDITGFGLVGHAREMALGSGVSIHLYADRIPVLEGALECVRAGFIPGGLKANREFAECLVGYGPGITEEIKTILFDPQTAGGLLLSVAREDAAPMLAALKAVNVPAVEIGEVFPQEKPLIRIA